MAKSKRSSKTKQRQRYALHDMQRTSSCFILTLRDNKGRVCSVAVRPDAMSGIPDKDIKRATKFLHDTAEGKRVKSKKKRKALVTLQSLTGIALAELSELANMAESGVAVIAADADNSSAAKPFEMSRADEAGSAGKGKGKAKGKGKNKSKGKRKDKADLKPNGKKPQGKPAKKKEKERKAAARAAEADRGLIPSEISRKLGKKATKRIERLLRTAIERELAYVLEQEARKWTRLTIETSGIGDYKISGSHAASEAVREEPETGLAPVPAMPESWTAPVDYTKVIAEAVEQGRVPSGPLVAEDPLDGNAFPEDAFAAPSAKEQAVLEYLREHPTATQTSIAEALYISRSTVADYTASLQAKGALAREGSRRAGRWVVLG